MISVLLFEIFKLFGSLDVVVASKLYSILPIDFFCISGFRSVTDLSNSKSFKVCC